MRRLLGIAVLVAMAGCGGDDPLTEQQRLEAEFEKTMTGAVLAGKFSVTGRERLSDERYTISGVSKVGGDVWLIHSRIQYGERDVTVPVPVKVLWAGDTPVLSLTDVAESWNDFMASSFRMLRSFWAPSSVGFNLIVVCSLRSSTK